MDKGRKNPPTHAGAVHIRQDQVTDGGIGVLYKHDLHINEVHVHLDSGVPRHSEQPPTTHLDNESLAVQEQRLRKYIKDKFVNLRVRLGRDCMGDLPLADMYIDLKVVSDVPMAADAFSVEERRLFAKLQDPEAGRGEIQPQLEALRYQRRRFLGRPEGPWEPAQSLLKYMNGPNLQPLVILGDPGSGKSTLLRYIALCAVGASNQSMTKDSTTAGFMPAGILTGLLPIWLPLAAYDSYCQNGPQISLQKYLAMYWKEHEHQPDLAAVFERALQAGQALVLFDGLDEVTATQRAFIKEQVEAFTRTWSAAGNWIVITSRIIGYHEYPLSSQFDPITVVDLGDRDIELFLQCWCVALEEYTNGSLTEPDQTGARQRAERITQEIAKRPHVRALACNPLTLTMLALLYQEDEQLPERRIELYNQFIDLMVNLRPEQRSEGARQAQTTRLPRPRVSKYLRDLALWLQTHKPSGIATDQEVRTQLQKTALQLDALDWRRPTEREQLTAEELASDLLDEFRQVIGVLAERGPNAYGFLHRTYQEFFAADALARMTPDERWGWVRHRLHDPRSREALLLCGGCLGVLKDKGTDADDFVLQVQNAGSDYEDILHRDVYLAAAMVTENINVSAPVLDQMGDALARLLGPGEWSVDDEQLKGLVALAGLGHRSSVEHIIEMLGSNSSLDSQKNFIVYCAIPDILEKEGCEDIRKQIVDQLYTQDFNDNVIFAVSTLVRVDASVRQRVIQLMKERKYLNSASQVLAPLIRNFPDVRNACLDYISIPIVRSVVLNMLALQIPTDPVVTQLISDNWSKDDIFLSSWAFARGAAILAENDETWREQLLQRLDDKRWDIQEDAIFFLGRLAITHPPVRSALLARMKAAVMDRDLACAEKLVTALGPAARVDEDVRATLVQFVDISGGPRQPVTIDALGGLVPFHSEVSRLIRSRLSDNVPDTRRAAIRALAPFAVDDRSLCREIGQQLDRFDACPMAERIASIAPFAQHDEQVRERVVELLKSADALTRVASVCALAPIAPRYPHIQQRIAALLDDESPGVRKEAIEAVRRAFPNDEQLRVRALAEVSRADSPTAQIAVRALEPFLRKSGSIDVKRCLLGAVYRSLVANHSKHIEQVKETGIAAANVLAPLIVSDKETAALFRRLAAILDIQGVANPVSAYITVLLQSAIDHDESIHWSIGNHLEKCSAGSPEFGALISYPSLPGLRAALERAKHGETRRDLIVRGMGHWITTDIDARRFILDAASEENPFVLKEVIAALAPLVTQDEEAKTAVMRIIESGLTLGPFQDSLSPLVGYVAQLPEIQKLFWAILDGSSSENHKSPALPVEHRVQAVEGLARLVEIGDIDARDRLLPWLGFRSPAGDKRGHKLRQQLAHAFCQHLREDSKLYSIVVAMLNSPAWQERQGAAWTLLAIDDTVPNTRNKMRDLLDDQRGEESWLERIEAAAAVLNHRDQTLSRRAVAVLVEALGYGKQSYYVALGWQIRSRAAEILATVEPLYFDKVQSDKVAAALREESSSQAVYHLRRALHNLASAGHFSASS